VSESTQRFCCHEATPADGELPRRTNDIPARSPHLRGGKSLCETGITAAARFDIGFTDQEKADLVAS